jgi:drug/metabolite transporter, DME family
MNHPSVLQGRLYLVAAAMLWSLSGAFVKLLRPPEAGPDGTLAVPGFVELGLGDPRLLGLGDPPVSPLVMACARGLFGGLAFLPALRRHHIQFKPLMLVMVLCFAAMNVLFVSAMGLGSAANAIFLQYTAPLFMYVGSVLWLKEPADRRNFIALAVAMSGVAMIVGGAMFGGDEPRRSLELLAVVIALGSGVTFAALLLIIRVLRDVHPTWITLQNHLVAGLVLLPFFVMDPPATLRQWICLILFGAVQMALPYWLASRGLRAVSPQEAGMILLLEPLLNPVWAYLAAGELPERWTVIGGAVILGALAWRYWPQRSKR